MRQVSTSVWTVVGLLAHVVFFLAGLLGIMLLPLLLEIQHPDSAIVFPIRWLRAHLSEPNFLVAYLLIQGGLASILTYATIVYDHLRLERMVSGRQEP